MRTVAIQTCVTIRADSVVRFIFAVRFPSLPFPSGKQSKAFKSPIAAHAESKRCFTAVGSNRNGQLRELNLEGDSKEQVAAWLVGINGILTHK